MITRTNVWRVLVLPLLLVAAAVALTKMERDLAENTLYIFFVGAVSIATWRGGRTGGGIAIVLSIAAVDFAFMEPRGEFHIAALGPAVRLISFLAVAGAIAWLIDALSRERIQAEALRREAERANAAKSDFLSTMSHELRTPINALLGYADLIDVGIAGPVTTEQQDYLVRLRAAAHHLLDLVNDLLDLARVDARRLTLRPTRQLVREVVDEAMAVVVPQAARKQIALAPPAGDALLTIQADRERVRQILVNLLGNAVKFTPEHGRISVSWGVGGQGQQHSGRPASLVWLRVTDSGIGIAEDDQKRVFEPFEQVETRLARGSGGTGLGLAISRQLAHAMGGNITLESELGRGSTFTVTLPRAMSDDSTIDGRGASATSTSVVVK